MCPEISVSESPVIDDMAGEMTLSQMIVFDCLDSGIPETEYDGTNWLS